MAEFHKVIGIDLGTTFSVVSAFSWDKKDVIVIPNAHNQRTTPSVVYISKTGQITVGESARKQLEKDPGGVIIETKRLMGEWEQNGKIKKTIAVAGRSPLEPEFVSACILKEMKGYAEKFIGAPIHDAVITVPAYFTEPQKNATRDAALLARLNPRLIVNEPTAAAVAYGLEQDEDSTYIVYDFGGGTFDVSIVRVKGGKHFDVLGTGGDRHLGGGDIDQKIIDWALANMRRDYSRDFSGDAKLVGRLRLEAERVKVNLCNSNAEQEFSLNFVTSEIEQISYFLGPGEFKRMIQPILQKTRDQVNVAMESAGKGHGLTWDDIDSFVLVGGSSKMPYVREMLTEAFHKPIKSDLNPDEIVSIGAARLAVDFQPSLGADPTGEKPIELDHAAVVSPAAGAMVDPQIKDVVSHTLGIGLKGDVFDPIIKKDTYIPHRITRDGYTTSEDNQVNIYIAMFQGDNPKASLNYQLGEVIISGLTPAPKGTHRFSVTFALDANGIFDGEVLHMQTGNREPIKLQRGQDALVQKKRIELADALDKGKVLMGAATEGGGGGAVPGPQAPPPDPVSALLEQALKSMDTLPASGQAELREAISQLDTASKNRWPTGQAVLRITMILNKYRTNN